MKGRTAIEARQGRLRTLKATIKKAEEEGREIDKEKFTLVVMFEFGITRKLATEYLQVCGIE